MTKELVVDTGESVLLFEIGEYDGTTYALHRDREHAKFMIGIWNEKKGEITNVIGIEGGYLPGMKTFWETEDVERALVGAAFMLGYRMPKSNRKMGGRDHV
jgi:hypothetical protein